MKKLWVVIFILNSALTLPARATHPRCNLRAMMELIEPLHQSLTTPEERKMIDDWFRDPDLNFESSAKATFELVFHKRLSLIPEEARKAVLARVSERVQSFHPTDLNGSYHLNTRVIKTINPKSLKDTPLEYSTLIHEAEHAVQEHVFPNAEVEEALGNDRLQARFEQEYGAMLAEWQYLNSLPPDILDKTEKLALESTLRKEKKSYVSRRFKNAKGTPEEYLRKEWAAGRYSYRSLQDDLKYRLSRREKVLVWGIIGSADYLMTCTLLKLQKKTRGKFFRRVCAPFYLNPE